MLNAVLARGYLALIAAVVIVLLVTLDGQIKNALQTVVDAL